VYGYDSEFRVQESARHPYARHLEAHTMGWRGNASTSARASSRVTPASLITENAASALSVAVGSHRNLSMRPSRSSGAYSVLRSFPVTMMGTRASRSPSRHVSPVEVLGVRCSSGRQPWFDNAQRLNKYL